MGIVGVGIGVGVEAGVVVGAGVGDTRVAGVSVCVAAPHATRSAVDSIATRARKWIIRTSLAELTLSDGSSP